MSPCRTTQVFDGLVINVRRSKTNSHFFSSNQDAKLNKKMGGRSHVITSGAIGTLYCAVQVFFHNQEYMTFFVINLKTEF